MSGLGYSDSIAHVRDELVRIDQVLRGQVSEAVATFGDLDGLDGVAEDPAEHRTAAAEQAKLIAERVAASTVLLRLPTLVDRFGLDDYQRDVLLLCLLVAVNEPARLLANRLGEDSGELTVVAALRAVAPDLAGTSKAWSVLAASGSLVGHQLVVLEPTGALRVEPRVARHLLDDDALEESLTGSASIEVSDVDLTSLALDAELRHTLCRLADWLGSQRRPTVVFLHGPPGSGRRTVAAGIAAHSGRPLLRVDLQTVRSDSWAEVVRLCYRDALLRDAAVCWTGVRPPGDGGHAEPWATLITAASRFPGLTLMTSAVAGDPTGVFTDGHFLRVEIPAPDFAGRCQLWHQMLPAALALGLSAPERVELCASLANTFRLTPGQIRDAIGSALSLARLRTPAAPAPSAEELREGCRRQAGRRLVAFARRVEPRGELTFEDLVLPAQSQRRLRELNARIALTGRVFGELGFARRVNLGRGLVAVFTGPSGTGKTMAAELLAKEHGQDLYKIDLAAVVSKYVGETEKHLDRAFADAERANGMLFFDEADALFAKRGEVREARDRWANVETAFLLQRVEEYGGVVILASNLRQNIDSAFLRRTQAVIEFPMPTVAGRRRIWHGMFPSELRRPPDEEIAELATRFPLSGGSIRNVVLDVTFRALAANPDELAVGLSDLVVSVALEYQKLGLPITPGEFGARFYEWVERELLLDDPEGDLA